MSAADAVEAAVRDVIAAWARAFEEKSVTNAMATHAADIVSFDIVPPLRYVGKGAYLAAWEAALPSFEGPIEMTIRDLEVRVDGDLAVAWALNRFQGRSGSSGIDYWFRWTAVLERAHERWLIVHDHQSLPTDFATGRSVHTLAP